MGYELRLAAEQGAVKADAGADSVRSQNAQNAQQANEGENIIRSKDTGTAAQTAAVPERPAEMFANLLKALGLKVTPETLRLPEFMMKNQIPLTEANVRLFNQAVKLFGGDLAKAAFMFVNNLPQTAAQAAAVNTFLAQNAAMLTTQLAALAQSLEGMPPNVKAAVLEGTAVGRGLAPAAQQPAQPQTAQPAAPQTALTQHSTFITQHSLPNIQHSLPAAAPQPVQSAPVQYPTPNIQHSLPANAAQQAQQAQQTPVQHSTPNVQHSPLPVEAVRGIEQPVQAQIEQITAEASPRPTLTEIPQPAQPAPIQHSTPNIQHFENLFTKFSLPIASLAQQNPNAAVIDEILAQLRQALTEVSGQIQRLGATTPETTEIFANIDRQAAFITQIKHCTYVQFPIATSNGTTDAELFVFRDRRKKAAKDSASSALIALNLANLGRLETYVRKTNRTIDCQFRAEQPNTLNVLKEHMPELSEMLGNAGFTLSALQFKSIEQPFTVIDEEPVLNETPEAAVTFGLDEWG